MSRALSRDQILAADDLQRVEVDVPEWGGSVFLRTMTAGERDRLEGQYQKHKTNDLRARVAVVCCVDEAGNRLFTDADVPTLSRKSGAALGRLFDKISDLNFLTKSHVDELEGNSESGPSGS